MALPTIIFGDFFLLSKLFDNLTTFCLFLIILRAPQMKKKNLLLKLTNKPNLPNLSFRGYILFLKTKFVLSKLLLKIGQQKVTKFCPSD